MLQIVKLQNNGDREDCMQFSLIGHLQAEYLHEIRELIRREPRRVLLDLREVHLVDRKAVEFLAACEGDGVTLRNCSPYIRHWIDLEEVRKRTSTSGETY